MKKLMDKIPYHIIAKYFAGECTREEIQQLDQWKNASPGNMKTFRDYAEVWNAEMVADDFNPDVEKALGKVKARIPGEKTQTLEKKSSGWRIFYRVAAVFIITLGIGFMYIYIQKSKETLFVDINTGNETRELTLPDSSKVWLNKHTRFSYPKKFDKHQREVKLSGEAYFKVEKANAWPFFIETPGAMIEVVGTEFNVNTGQDETNNVVVSVSEGKVKMASESEKEQIIELTDGEQGILDKKANTLSKEKIIKPDYSAWAGKLVFNHHDLKQVAASLEKHYHTKVVITGKEIQGLTLKASYDNKSLEEIIELLEITLELDISKRNDTLVFSKK